MSDKSEASGEVILIEDHPCLITWPEHRDLGLFLRCRQCGESYLAHMTIRFEGTA